MALGYEAGGWNYKVGEHHLYGSSRIGVHQTDLLLRSRFDEGDILVTLEDVDYTSLYRGKRHYELSNHLGNVQVVLSDKRISVCDGELEVEYFKADVLSAMDYYPFGMMMPDRQWYANSDSSSYRFAFNGKELDREHGAAGNVYDYGFRIYNPVVGRFFTIDPMRRSFPHLSPYIFAENRVIDGVDLDGLEYLTFHFLIYDNGTGAILINVVDYRNVEQFDYNEYSESFGPEGRGVKYVYHYVNESGEITGTKVMWEVRQNDSKSDLGRHGLFMGAGSITNAGPLFDVENTGNDYAFGYHPVDEVDAAAYEHDVAHSEIDNYQGWLEDTRTYPSDKKLLEDFNNYYLEHVDMNSGLVIGVDKVTGRAPSREAVNAALTGSIFFRMVVDYKEWKIQQLENMGLDPYALESQNKVTLEDYKGSWWQFKRNAAYKILKSAQEPPK